RGARAAALRGTAGQARRQVGAALHGVVDPATVRGRAPRLAGARGGAPAMGGVRPAAHVRRGVAAVAWRAGRVTDRIRGAGADARDRRLDTAGEAGQARAG